MAEPLIVIDGREYPFPLAETWSFGEARLLKRYTGKSQNQLEDEDAFDPDFQAGLIHIAFARANPQLRPSDIEKLVNDVKIAAVDVTGLGEETPDPPASAPPTLPPAETKPPATESSTGDGSRNGGDHYPETITQPSTGTPV